MSPFHCGSCGYLSAYHVLGMCPGLKTKKWTDRDPVDGALWREIMARDVAARMRAMDEETRPYEPIIIPAPIVPARPPRSRTEFAGARGKQAAGLGAAAAKNGFQVAPFYWQAGDGAEGCAVKGFRTELAFVATWKRPPGHAGRAPGWRTDIAYIWNPSDRRGPQRITHTDLEGIVT
jgi:hypothetical protein